MISPAALFLAFTVPAVAVMVLLWRSPLNLTARRLTKPIQALRQSRDKEVSWWGWLPVLIVVVAAGWALILGSMWILGEVAQQLEATIDVPVFDAVAAGQQESWSSIFEVVTKMGNRRQIQATAFVAAIVLAIAYRRSGWWIPPAALFGAYVLTKTLQETLALMVDRGHPPTTLGTYPSGGVARIAVEWGMIVVLILALRPDLGHRVRWGLWSVVVLGMSIEAFARTYNLQHWITDALASLVFGPLVLALSAVALHVVLSARAHRRPLVRTLEEAQVHTAG